MKILYLNTPAMMAMQIKYLCALPILFLTVSSCGKFTLDDPKEETVPIQISGTIRDEATKEPVAGIELSVDAIKPPTGMGLITDGRRKAAGKTVTDANGFYKLNLHVLKEAEFLEFWLNPGNRNTSYMDQQQDIHLSAFNPQAANHLDLILSPIALLKINFKNAAPVSDTDYFQFSTQPQSGGFPRSVLEEETCGTVQPTPYNRSWTGKDVCGAYTVNAIAGKPIAIFWTVRKNGSTKNFHDSVFIKKGVLNEFSINY